MTLALDSRNVEQGVLIDDRRSAKQRPRNRYLVLARELPDQSARRIGNDRQSLCQLSTRGYFGVRNEVDQGTVEQIDVIGPQSSSRLEVQPGDQRGCDCHQKDPKPATAANSPAI